jgi:hypothetical protein
MVAVTDIGTANKQACRPVRMYVTNGFFRMLPRTHIDSPKATIMTCIVCEE